MGLETRTKVPVFSKNSNGTWIEISILNFFGTEVFEKNLEKGLKPAVG
jgi:hypothetical protein